MSTWPRQWGVAEMRPATPAVEDLRAVLSQQRVVRDFAQLKAISLHFCMVVTLLAAKPQGPNLRNATRTLQSISIMSFGATLLVSEFSVRVGLRVIARRSSQNMPAARLCLGFSCELEALRPQNTLILTIL